MNGREYWEKICRGGQVCSLSFMDHHAINVDITSTTHDTHSLTRERNSHAHTTHPRARHAHAATGLHRDRCTALGGHICHLSRPAQRISACLLGSLCRLERESRALTTGRRYTVGRHATMHAIPLSCADHRTYPSVLVATEPSAPPVRLVPRFAVSLLLLLLSLIHI